MNRADDAAHDAYLQQALRNAPDADAKPPPQLSEAILRAARSAVPQRVPHGGAAAPMQSALSALWQWLALPRIATGLASVMVATLAGVMWWGQPVEPMRETPAPAPASSRTAASVDAPAAAPKPMPATQQAAEASTQPAREARFETSVKQKSPDLAQRPLGPTGPDRGAERATARPQRSAAGPVGAAALEAPAVTPPTPPNSLPSPPELSKQRSEVKSAPHDNASPGALAAAPAAPAPAVQAEANATMAAAGATEPAEQRRDRERERLADRQTAGDRAGAPAAARAERSVARSAPVLAAAPSNPIGRLRADIAAAPERWQWRWADGELRAADASLLEWLARAEAATAAVRAQGREGLSVAAGISAANSVAKSAAKSPADDATAPALTLLVDGKPSRLIQLAQGRVRLATPDGNTRFLDAELAPMAIDDLRASIEAMAR